jgi:hypothetical protein
MHPLQGVGIALLVTACVAAPTPTPPTPSASVPPASPTSATATPMASPTPIESSQPSPNPAWEQIAGIEAFDGLQLDHVVWTGTRFLASSGGDGLVLLESTDGRAWRRLPSLAGRGSFLSALVAGTSGVIGVEGGRTWFSRDGLSWTRGDAVGTAAGPRDRAVAMSDVVETDGGWLGVGAETPFCPVGCSLDGTTAITWHSSDGLAWTRDPTSPALRDATMAAVTRKDAGFIAVGGAQVGRHQQAAVWLSEDGRAWDRVPDADVFGAPAEANQGWVGMTDVVAVPGLVAATGQAYSQDFGGSALAWFSRDGGTTWERAAGDQFLNGQIFAVAAIPGGFAATGPSGNLSCRGGIWVSSDGTAWRCVADDPSFRGFSAYAAAASPTTLVVVGFGGGERRLEATVWVHGVASLEALR